MSATPPSPPTGPLPPSEQTGSTGSTAPKPPGGDGPSADRAFIERAVRLGIVGAVAIAAVVGMLWLLKGAFTPLVAAWVIAYLLDPLIDRFEARGVPRSAAILLLLAVFGVALGATALLLVPQILRELAVVSQELPGYLDRTLSSLAPLLREHLGITLPDSVKGAVEAVRAGEVPIPLDAARDLLQRVVAGVTGTVGALVSLVLIPVLAYYLLVEFDRLRLAVLDLVPRAYQHRVAMDATRVDRLVAGFIRGQLTVCLALGVLYAVGFSVIGVDLAIPIGIVSGFLAIVPYVGGAAALLMASGMCVLEFGPGVELLAVVGWYAVVQILEGFVLVPRILGGSLGMHPVTVILALLIGGDLLGFLGLLVAVPLAAVAQVFLQDAAAAYRGSTLYRSATSTDEAADADAAS